MDRLLGRDVIMLATLKCVCGGVDDKEAKGNAGSDEL
jgi:hypothetical protein